MPRSLSEPFTEAEMQAIRRAASGQGEGAHASEANVRRNFWRSLKRVARQAPFAHDLAAAFYCARDPATPLKVRMILFGALGYFILPVDAVSDFLPLVGFTDDIAVLTLAIATVTTAIRPEHRQRAEQALADAGFEEPPHTVDATDAKSANGGWKKWARWRHK